MNDTPVDAQQIIDKLLKTIGDLHLRNAVLEAHLDSVVKYRKGGEQDESDTSGTDNGDAETKGSGRPRDVSTETA